MQDKYQTISETLIHIDLVSQYLESIKYELSLRQFSHDRSKLQPEELDTSFTLGEIGSPGESFIEYSPKLKASEYNSPEYHANLAAMKPALDHHYAHNKHHIQFHEEGLMGMTLVDIIEMLVDWVASASRSNSDIYKSLEMNKERFNIPDPLYQILKNTIDKMTNRYRDLNSQANL